MSVVIEAKSFYNHMIASDQIKCSCFYEAHLEIVKLSAYLHVIPCLGSDADWSIYDTVELLRKHGKRFTIPPLIDQGDADVFIEKDLMPNELAKACVEVGQEINLRYQKGYDHFYFFISTFIEDHLKFHLDNLSKL
ncbi:hypothetical protein Aperf_G00000009805 [Anoplocephala perfoliata]